MSTIALPNSDSRSASALGLAVLLGLGLAVLLWLIMLMGYGARISFSRSTPVEAEDNLLDQLIAAGRAIVWAPGIPGGIPNRTTVCADLTAGASTATIQSAINSCPVGQVVSFGAGTFTLTTDLEVEKGIVLRGQGPNSTTIALNGQIIFGTNSDGPPDTARVPSNWTGGLSAGSTILTVASTTNMHADQVVVLDEHNPSWVFTESGVAGPCYDGNSCGRDDYPFGANAWYDNMGPRAAPQMVRIVSVDSSTQITVADPIGYTHTAGLDPEVFFWDHGATHGNMQYAGIEDVKIDANSNSFALAFHFCDYCWVKNVAVYELARSAVLFKWSYGGVIRDSYIQSTLGGGPTQYGFEVYATSNILIENNICFNVTACILPQTSYGAVVSYNYMDNKVSGVLFANYTPHLSHNQFQLVEGNVANTLSYDNSWGSSSNNTLFRNRALGTGTNKTSYRRAIQVNGYNRHINIIGNVAGDPGHHDRYACDEDNDLSAGDDDFIYDLGAWENCGGAVGSPPYDDPYDSGVKPSLLRWGNWDSDTYLANGSTNGIRYCTASGVGNAACTESEVPTGDPVFPIAAPTTTFPVSLYLDSAPSWFGSVTWPPIGPDVTGGDIANTGGHAYKIPSQRCYDDSPKDGSGYLTSYDAEDCY